MPWHPHGFRRRMAFEALVVAHETRVVLLVLVERVEHGAELGIGFRNLQNRRAGHIAHVNVVAEEKRPWMLWVDALALKRGLGKDQHLRGFPRFELFQNREQKPELLIAAQ